MATPMTPQDIVERCLELSKADDCVVLVDESDSANMRWANNTLTTNGAMRSRVVTVVSTIGDASGTAAGWLRGARSRRSRSNPGRAAEQTARDNPPADDARALVQGEPAEGWDQPAGETTGSIRGHLAGARRGVQARHGG